MPIEKRDAGKTRKARRPYRFDVCKRGHGMRDPENVVVSHAGYENCRTCINERQRDKRAKKRAVRVRRANRLREFKAVEATRPANGQLGRQGDMDRMLEVVRLRRAVRKLEDAVQEDHRLAESLRQSLAAAMGDHAALVASRRAWTMELLAGGGAVGAALSAAVLFVLFLA